MSTAACSTAGDAGPALGDAPSGATSAAGTAAPDGTIVDRPTGDDPWLTRDGEVPRVPDVDIEMGPSRLGERIVETDNPIDVVVRPGDERLFVVERTGAVKVIDDGQVSATALDLSDSVVPELEWGLLGMTFSAVGPDGTFDVDSQRIVYRYDQPAEAHNGGNLLIGPDGYLYVFNGDGGGDRDDDELGGAWNSDIHRQAQALDSPLGKILRIDPEASDTGEFTIPVGNPYVGVEGALPEIWAIGVRNPWRNGFDPLTGDLWVADVGNFDREEVTRLASDGSGLNAGSGLSLGWSAWEGFGRANEDQRADGHLVPTYEYRHGELGCSVVGGPVYRGTAFADLDGKYLFGDHCTGMIWAMEVDDDFTPVAIETIAALPFLVDIEVTPDGGIVATSIVEGVHRLVP